MGADVLSGPPPDGGGGVPGADARSGPQARTGLSPRLLILLGPTGTGKTETSVLVAERIGGEIVGCDALQVYRGFDAATGKPSHADRRRVPHHLVDVADPRTDFSLSRYVRLAEQAVADIARRGKVPMIVGGTGMYLRGLLRGVATAPDRDPALRARLRAMAARHGTPRLHRWLATIDPGSAARLGPGDTHRVVRGIELALAGSTWSDTLRREGTWSGPHERYRCVKVGLDMDRAVLARRLEARVEQFFDRGLPEEVEELLRVGVPEHANAFKGIGYRETLRATGKGVDPETVGPEILRNTLRYAKRQRTWFRREPGIVWLDAAEGPTALAARIVGLWEDEQNGS